MDAIDAAVDYVRGRTKERPVLGIICGSGSAALFQEDRGSIPYADIPGFPRTGVSGHASRLMVAELDGVWTAVMLGRLHWYEGRNMEELAFQVRLLVRLGIRHLILSNASGGLDPIGAPTGTFVVLRDHMSFLSLAGISPLRGANAESFGPRFPNLNTVYDRRSLQWVREAAAGTGAAVVSGIYANTGGPAYETPCELRFLKACGCTAVGMSTVPEVVTAAHASLSVTAIALVTNQCDMRDSLEEHDALTHAEVLLGAEKAASALQAILTRLPAIIARTLVDKTE